MITLENEEIAAARACVTRAQEDLDMARSDERATMEYLTALVNNLIESKKTLNVLLMRQPQIGSSSGATAVSATAGMMTCAGGSAVGHPYLAELRQQYSLLIQEQLEERKQQQLEEQRRQQSRIFIRQVCVQNVNVSLLKFVLDSGEEDGGVRQYLCRRARAIGVTGYARRNDHDHLIVRYDGNAEQVRRFKAVLDEMQEREICSEIYPCVAEVVKDFGEPELSDFFILSNVHARCKINAFSNGEKWEKRSSSVGSGEREVTYMIPDRHLPISKKAYSCG